jgi:hypothetical protein
MCVQHAVAQRRQKADDMLVVHGQYDPVAATQYGEMACW